MSKINLVPVTSVFNVLAINENNRKIAEALNQGVFWRKNPVGEPNELFNNLDMNGWRIYNLPKPVMAHEPARLEDVGNAPLFAEQAKEAAEKAEQAAKDILEILGTVSEVEYVAGNKITSLREYVIGPDGNVYTISPDTPLPYTIDGSWAVDSQYFILMSDASLRNQITNTTSPNQGAGMLPFSHALSYPNTSVGGALNHVINVKNAPFLAKGDGVADDSSAIQAAIDYASSIGGGVVHIPSGTYRFPDKSQIIGKSNVSIVGAPGSRLDFREADPLKGLQLDSFIQYKGYAPAGPLRTDSDATLTSDMKIGFDVINVNSTAGFQEGDLIEISSESEGPWKDTIKVNVGQLSKVVQVISSTSLKINMIAYDDYNVADNASVKKIIPIKNFYLYGLNVIGPGNTGTAADGYNETKGIGLYYCEDFSVQKCSVRGCMAWSIRPTSCYNFVIENNNITTPREAGSLTGSMYGIPITSSCMFGIIRGNEIVGPTSGILSSHLSRLLPVHYPGVSRYISVESNHLYTTSSGVAFHQDGEHWLITKNFCSGQGNACIRVRTRNVLVFGNILHPSGSNVDSNCILLSHQPRNVVVRDNMCYPVINTAILVTQLESGWVPHDIDISFNIINGYGHQTGSAISLSLLSGFGVSRGNSIKGNTIVDCRGAGGNASCILVAGPWSVDVTDNNIDNCVGLNGYRFVREVYKTFVRDNKYTNSGRVAFFFDTTIGGHVYLINNASSGHSTFISGSSNLAGNTGNIDMGA